MVCGVHWAFELLDCAGLALAFTCTISQQHQAHIHQIIVGGLHQAFEVGCKDVAFACAMFPQHQARTHKIMVDGVQQKVMGMQSARPWNCWMVLIFLLL